MATCYSYEKAASPKQKRLSASVPQTESQPLWRRLA